MNQNLRIFRGGSRKKKEEKKERPEHLFVSKKKESWSSEEERGRFPFGGLPALIRPLGGRERNWGKKRKKKGPPSYQGKTRELKLAMLKGEGLPSPYTEEGVLERSNSEGNLHAGG